MTDPLEPNAVAPLACLDAHCHIDLYPDPKAVVARTEQAGVHTIAVTNAPSVYFHTAELLAGRHFLRPAIGLHPELVANHAGELGLFAEHLGSTRYVGEIGLDFVTTDKELRQKQKDVFQAIIARCGECGDKVLTIHSRRAAARVMEIVGEAFPGRLIFHWFSGSLREMERAVALGFYFSVNAAMFRSKSGLELLKRIPHERVLTETDGPFLHCQDRPSEPTDTANVVRELALLWGTDGATTRQIILANLRRLLQESDRPAANQNALGNNQMQRDADNQKAERPKSSPRPAFVRPAKQRKMYTVHPDASRLLEGLPQALADAASNVHPLQYEQLLCMRNTVFRLVEVIRSLSPALVPFFATGGIPYVVPAMYRLADLGEHHLLDGQTFHMFPGIAWRGDSRASFKDGFGALLNMAGACRVVCADTTNAGNAVNNAVGGLLDASASSIEPVELLVIGIVNQSAATPAKGRSAIRRPDGPIAYVQLPGGTQPMAEIRDGEFQDFTGSVVPKHVSLRIAYWVVPAIPTEDEKDLIGAIGLHDELSVQSINAAGRFQLVCPNGERPLMTGLDSVSTRLLNLLSKEDASTFWKWAHASAALSPATPEVLAFREDTTLVTDGMFRLLELKHDPKAVDMLRNKPLLTGAEIFFLTEKGEFGQPFLGKVCHVLLNASVRDWRLIDAASTFMARACPDLATGIPAEASAVDLQAWWKLKLAKGTQQH